MLLSFASPERLWPEKTRSPRPKAAAPIFFYGTKKPADQEPAGFSLGEMAAL
jgi:hypothetical protein